MVQVTDITNTGTNVSYVSIMQGGERHLSPHYLGKKLEGNASVSEIKQWWCEQLQRYGGDHQN